MFSKIASRNLGREIAEETIEKVALETGRSRYPEYDQSSDVAKRMGKYIIPTTVAGAGIGAVRGGGIGAINGGAAGMIAGTIGAALHQTIRDSKAATKRYDDPKDIMTAQMWGPGVADKRIARREIAEDLTEKEASTRWARELGKSVDEAIHATPSSAEQRAAAQRANAIMSKTLWGREDNSMAKIIEGKTKKGGRPITAYTNPNDNPAYFKNLNTVNSDVRPINDSKLIGKLQSSKLQQHIDSQRKRNASRSSGDAMSILNSYK